MANVSDFEFGTRGLRNTDPRRGYDWESWLDGSVWEISEEEIPETLKTFQVRVHQVARKYGDRARTRTIEKDGRRYVVIQAYEPAPQAPQDPAQ